MAKTLREELENIFDRFNEFTTLGERYGFDEDIARIGKLMFAKQISDAYKPKVDKDLKRKEADKWLRDYVAAANESEKVDLVPDWDGYVKFLDAYKLLLKRLLMDLNKLKSQKWLDAKAIADTMNKINLRQMWRSKEQAAASLYQALAKTVYRA